MVKKILKIHLIFFIVKEKHLIFSILFSSSTMGTRVFVGGITYRVRERDIERFFRKYGRIKEISMKNGFAFVEFDDYRDADDAIYELNGKLS